MLSKNRFAFTQAEIDGLETPKTDTLHWDTRVTGFGLRHSSKGVKAFLVQYRVRLPDGTMKERQQNFRSS